MHESKTVCVYCASSDESEPIYRDVARRLGGLVVRSEARFDHGLALPPPYVFVPRTRKQESVPALRPVTV